MKRILIAGGGTGGHLYPGLAVAEAVTQQRPETEVLFVGTQRGIEGRVVPEAGYPFRSISVRGLPRRPSWAWVSFWFSLGKGIAEAWSLVRAWQPAVIVGTGGYVSVPAVCVGLLTGRPVVLLEQNRIPGLATRALARWARYVCLTFEDSARGFHRKDNLRVTGNPIRRRLTERVAAKQEPRKDPGPVRILAFGGSRGARQVNTLLTGSLAHLPKSLRLEFLVQTGEDDREWVEERFRESGFRASVRAYIDRIGEAYAEADFAVCRAGATTLAEITATGLPSILIPYPYAAAGHQEANAEVLAREGAAWVLDPRTATAADLAEAIRQLAENPEQRECMAAKARALGKPDAAREIAMLVHSLTQM